MNKFFGQEVPEEYLPKIKECFSNLQESKDLKLKLFEEQKKLNQIDYQHSQAELKQKQQIEEQIKVNRQQYEQKLNSLQIQFDIKRQNRLDASMKKEILDQELQHAIQQLVEANEISMNLKEEKSNI